jgi:hypothetical protein
MSCVRLKVRHRYIQRLSCTSSALDPDAATPVPKRARPRSIVAGCHNPPQLPSILPFRAGRRHLVVRPGPGHVGVPVFPNHNQIFMIALGNTLFPQSNCQI